MRTEMRKIKWIGDPPVLRKDGWSVGNWRYENKRLIAMKGTSRTISPKDVPGLSKTYKWEASDLSKIVEMPFGDARLLLATGSHEFVDVTDAINPSSVKHKPIILNA